MAACQDTAVPPTMIPTAVTVATSTPPPQPVSTDIPTPTPTSNPTPAVPHIAVNDQVLTDDGLVTIASVSSPQPGWAVIYTIQDDDLGEILGYTAVQTGINQDVTVTVNALDATPTLAVVLQKDEGTIGQFCPDLELQTPEVRTWPLIQRQLQLEYFSLEKAPGRETWHNLL